MSKHLVIAAGGTGGHLFPAQALAETMLERGWRVSLATDVRGLRYATAFPEEVARIELRSASPSRGGITAKLAVPTAVMRGIAQAWSTFRSDCPSVVAGFGGYPSLPAMAAAVALRLPRLIHEQNGVLGRVNQILASRVHKVACSVWPTELPAGVDAVHTGNPVRYAVRAEVGRSYKPPTADGPIALLVIGGSQGARILSQTIPVALAHLPIDMRRRLRVSHQARAEDLEMVTEAYRLARIEAEAAPFFDDVPERLAAAHLVISRAGASSVADITAIGRPSILVPLAIAVRDEQTANARGLVAAGGAILATEDELEPERISELLHYVLDFPDRAAEMAEAARAAGKPDAAETLAALVEELADR